MKDSTKAAFRNHIFDGYILSQPLRRAIIAFFEEHEDDRSKEGSAPLTLEQQQRRFIDNFPEG